MADEVESIFPADYRSIYGLLKAIKCLRAYVDSEGQDQPAHPRSLIMAFIVY